MQVDMRTARCAVLVLALVSAGATAAGAESAPAGVTTEIEAVFAAVPPGVDGRLDEAAWQAAPAVSDFRISDGGGRKAKCPVAVRVLYDRQALYFGIEAFNDMPQIAAARRPEKATEHDAWMLDGLEWYLSVSNPANYYFFCLSPLGLHADMHFGGGEDDPFDWNGTWKSGVSLQADRWVIEAAIPFSDVAEAPPRPGDVWLTNFARTNALAEPQDRLSALHPKYSGFHYLGVKLRFRPPPPASPHETVEGER